ncbi:MAG: DnaA regulatory inactivator Hda [Gammaproteobacteria bacterium]
MQQLPLNLRLRETATFDNFYAGQNQQILTYLKLHDHLSAYLWGKPGTGRSHLLQAACHQVNQRGYTTAYVPLAKLSPDILVGMENMQLICIDDIDIIAGDKAWEEALFHFYNKTHNQFLIAGNTIPDQLKLALPDLTSRLNACVRFQLLALKDDEKRTVLQQRAKARGLILSLEVGDFLLHHYSRDMSALCDVLEKLDEASLIAQRKLTIPFIKTILDV